jgi:hypothetical protein
MTMKVNGYLCHSQWRYKGLPSRYGGLLFKELHEIITIHFQEGCGVLNN